MDMFSVFCFIILLLIAAAIYGISQLISAIGGFFAGVGNFLASCSLILIPVIALIILIILISAAHEMSKEQRGRARILTYTSYVCPYLLFFGSCVVPMLWYRDSMTFGSLLLAIIALIIVAFLFSMIRTGLGAKHPVAAGIGTITVCTAADVFLLLFPFYTQYIRLCDQFGLLALR